ncbi:Na+/H+ antiporter subunit D [Nitratireductor pacificus]|uniref:Monovalent cation/H+ antiporter subunit D n=1 Tax=Nitratireductor pacificus pht-3B TaxID=391937 RepID=K2MR16_9HYPH|nr:Na+/H+ antiporter subunit D [Nitratireductor pacificus]EKF19802.1 monovalent cation/H+ antiporter subunit D [Nitratireductor pacificus pht-3B]
MAAETVDISNAMVTAPATLGDWLVVAPVAIPLVFGAVLLMVRHETRFHAGLAIAGLMATFAANVGLLERVLSEGPQAMTMGRWLPPFGISFAADALGASLALVATLVAIVCAIYATKEIDATGRRYGFYPFMLLMMAGVGGSFLTGDVFNLYVWFEVFLISSFGMLVLGSTHRQLDGATKYAILNLVGTTLFLTATAFLYGTFGTLNMADIAGKVDAMRDTGPLMTLTVLYLLAFGMKAAAFPLNFWLPASYHTPSIVTAALFGGVLTKVGVYAMMRILVMLFPVERAVLADLIAWVAAGTMVLGIMGALAQSDIRRVLGFVVISGVGVMMAGVALGTEAGLTGTVLYAFHSIIAMTALYLLAGVMNGLGGSYSLHELSGLYRNYPLLAAFALLLVLSAAGLPPASGLWPKVILVRASLDAGLPWLSFAILLTGLLTTVAMGRVFILTIWRQTAKPAENDTVVAGRPAVGYAALAMLSLPILLLGLYPEPLIRIATVSATGLLEASSYLGAVFPMEAQP